MPKVTIVNHGPEDIEVSWDQMEDVLAVPAKAELKQDGKVVQAAAPAVPASRRSVTRTCMIANAQQRQHDTAITGVLRVREAPKASK